MSLLTGLSTFCGQPNQGGLIEIEYIPTVDVNAAAYERIVSSSNNWQYEIPLLTGSWLKALVHPVNKSYRENNSTNKQGQHYDQLIEYIAPSLRPSVTRELELMTDYTYLLRITDLRNQPWIIGTLQDPIQFNGSAQTGKLGALNHYKLTWQGKTPSRAHGYFPVL